MSAAAAPATDSPCGCSGRGSSQQLIVGKKSWTTADLDDLEPHEELGIPRPRVTGVLVAKDGPGLPPDVADLALRHRAADPQVDAQPRIAFSFPDGRTYTRYFWVRRTTDIPTFGGTPQGIPASAANAQTVAYQGHVSSALFVFDKLHNYVGFRQPNPIGPQFVNLAALGLADGAAFVRHYERGIASAFTSWNEFATLLISQLDRTVYDEARKKGYGAEPIPNTGSVSPVLRLSRRLFQDPEYAGQFYGANTRDVFRVERKYRVSQSVFSQTLALAFTGSFRIFQDHSIGYALESVELSGISRDNVASLRPVFQERIPSALTAAINDTLFVAPDVALQCQFASVSSAESVLNCGPLPGATMPDATCSAAAEEIGRTLLVGALPSYQVRCAEYKTRKLDDISSTVSSCVLPPFKRICEFRPYVYAIQYYPTGFEVVLSREVGDKGYTFLTSTMALLGSADPSQRDRIRGFFDPSRPPFDRGRIQKGQLTSFFPAALPPSQPADESRPV